MKIWLVLIIACLGCNLSDDRPILGTVNNSPKANNKKEDMSYTDTSNDAGLDHGDVRYNSDMTLPDMSVMNDVGQDVANDVVLDTVSDVAADVVEDIAEDVVEGPKCGDALVNNTETCDGENLGGKSCITEGFLGGVLSCNSTCDLDKTGCLNTGRITSGKDYSCYLNSQNKAECWGTSNFGITTPANDTFVNLSGGERHACGLKADGSLKCWGSFANGLLASPPGKFKAVAVGEFHACGILLNGSLQCWGDNTGGKANPPNGQYKDIDAAKDYSCALNTQGKVSCWGAFPYSAIGSDIPIDSFSQVSTGDQLVCGMADDKQSLECWGFLFAVDNVSIKQITSGEDFFCNISASDKAFCSGGYSVAESHRFLEIKAGNNHVCGIKTDNSLKCWGDNDEGQSSPP